MAKVNTGRTRVKPDQSRTGGTKPVNKSKPAQQVRSKDRTPARTSSGRQATARSSGRGATAKGSADQELKVGRGRPSKKDVPQHGKVKCATAARGTSTRAARVPHGNVSVDQLLYRVEVIGRAPIIVSGMLVSYNEKTLVMRHKRERSSKIIVESFAMRDVVFINGHEGEQATVCVNVVAVIRTFEGQLKSLVGADYIEVILANGEQVVLNRNSSAGLEVKITAIEDDVSPEIKRKVDANGSSSSVVADDEGDADSDDGIDENEQFEDDEGLPEDPLDDAESFDEDDAGDADDADEYDE